MFMAVQGEGEHREGNSSLFMEGGATLAGGKENILHSPKLYWLNSTVFPERFGTPHFFSFNVFRNQKMLPKSSSQQLETAGSHKCLSVTYWLPALLNIIENLSVFCPIAFVDDLALFQSFSQN